MSRCVFRVPTLVGFFLNPLGAKKRMMLEVDFPASRRKIRGAVHCNCDDFDWNAAGDLFRLQEHRGCVMFGSSCQSRFLAGLGRLSATRRTCLASPCARRVDPDSDLRLRRVVSHLSGAHLDRRASATFAIVSPGIVEWRHRVLRYGAEKTG